MIEKTYPNPPVEIQEMLDIPPVNSLNYSDWFQKPVVFPRQLGTTWGI